MRHWVNVAKWLFEAGEDETAKPPIDGSPEARLQRAQEQGFDINDPHYHGTPGGHIDRFDPNRTADEDLAYGKGVYASRSPEAASGYSKPGASWGNSHADEPAPTVYKVYMRVKNPFDLQRAYPYAEVKRIFEHCFDEEEMKHLPLWRELIQDVWGYDPAAEQEDDADDEYREKTQVEELEDQLFELDGADPAADLDPDDYDDGKDDVDYKAALEREEQWIERQKKDIRSRIERINQREEEEYQNKLKAIETGKIGSVYGSDIYRELWTHSPEYHDWKAERKLFGGESDTFLFKTWANEQLEELGYDGLRHVDHYNPGVTGHRGAHVVTIAFRPHQVRSVHAQFHPEQTDSDDLMA
jgi:hypothetical protein